ncbi:MAG: hypothetical protein J2P22_04025 [Nocardioides sp.]|nr:hypothetical protein [Nocardioides sp.]
MNGPRDAAGRSPMAEGPADIKTNVQSASRPTLYDPADSPCEASLVGRRRTTIAAELRARYADDVCECGHQRREHYDATGATRGDLCCTCAGYAWRDRPDRPSNDDRRLKATAAEIEAREVDPFDPMFNLATWEKIHGPVGGTQ